ncbi:MAG: peroxidase, partial [Deltaproteobacteria bacterium]
MAFIDTIPPAAADAAVAGMYLRQEAAWGYVPNYAKVFCHRPEVLARWGQLLAEIKRPMDKRRFELVTFTAAHELR